MAVLLTQIDDAAAAGCIAAHCSGNSNNTDTESNKARRYGTVGTTPRTVTLDASAADLNCVWMECQLPDEYDGASGNWTVNIRISTGNMQVTLDEIHICRLNSLNENQGTLASSVAIGQSITSAQTYPFLVNQASPAIFDPGDKALIIFAFDNGQGMANDFAYVPDQQIQAPGSSPILFNEQWENLSGTDEVWTSKTEVSGTVGDDKAVSAIGSIPWWADECMECVVTAASSNAFRTMDLPANVDVAYLVADLRIDAHALTGDGQAFAIIDAFDDTAAGDSDRIFRVLFQRVTSTTFRWLLQDWRDDSENTGVTGTGLWEIDQPYRIAIKWDVTANKVTAMLDNQIFTDEVDITGTRNGLRTFRVGLQSMPVTATIQCDNVVIRDDDWALPIQTKETSSTNLFHAEQLEASPGYDEVWSDGENVGSGNTVDPDADPSTISAPSSWGNEAFKIVIGATAAGGLVRDQQDSPTTTKLFLRAELYVASESLTNGTEANFVFLKKDHAGGESNLSLELYEDAVRGLHARMKLADSGKDIVVVPSLSITTFYVWEIKIDFTNGFYSVWLDGVLRVVGAWLTGWYQSNNWLIMGQSQGASGRNVTYWIDNYLVSEVGFPVVPITGLIIEGSEAGDTFAAIATAYGAVDEGSKLGDTETGLAVSLASISEGMELGDTQVALASALASIAEGVKSGDTQAALASALASIAEGTKEGDTLAALAIAWTAARQWLISGYGFIDEDGDREFLISGYGFFNEDTVAVSLASMAEGSKLGDTFVRVVGTAQSISEGAKLGDTQAALATALASFSEGLEAGDVQAALATALASVVEGSELGDTIIAFRTLLGSISDGLKAGDTQAALASALASVDEGSKLGDTLNRIVAIRRSIAEGSKLGDTVSATAAAIASIAEGLKAGDADGGLAGALAAMTEGTAAGELFTALATAAGALTEGAKLGESWVVQAQALATLVEGSKLGDTFDGSVAGLITGAITEGSKSGNTFVRAVGVVRSVLEGSKAGDTVTAAAQAVAALADGAKLGDTLVRVVGTPQSISEGAKLGDTHAALAIALASLSEGLKAGDVQTAQAAALSSISGGLKGGDSWTRIVGLKVGSTEGAKLGDVFAAIAGASAVLAEGVKLGDIWTATVAAYGAVSEGIELGDAIARPVDIDVGLVLAAITISAAIAGGPSASPSISGDFDIMPSVDGEPMIN